MFKCMVSNVQVNLVCSLRATREVLSYAEVLLARGLRWEDKLPKLCVFAVGHPITIRHLTLWLFRAD